MKNIYFVTFFYFFMIMITILLRDPYKKIKHAPIRMVVNRKPTRFVNNSSNIAPTMDAPAGLLPAKPNDMADLLIVLRNEMMSGNWDEHQQDHLEQIYKLSQISPGMLGEASQKLAMDTAIRGRAFLVYRAVKADNHAALRGHVNALLLLVGAQRIWTHQKIQSYVDEDYLASPGDRAEIETSQRIVHAILVGTAHLYRADPTLQAAVRRAPRLLPVKFPTTGSAATDGGIALETLISAELNLLMIEAWTGRMGRLGPAPSLIATVDEHGTDEQKETMQAILTMHRLMRR